MTHTELPHPTFADLELLSEVSQLLTLLDLDRVLQKVMSLAAKAVGATKVSLFLHDEYDVDWGHIFVTRDLSPDEFFHVVRSVLDKGLAGWVLRHRTAAIVYDTDVDERWIVFPDDTYKVGSALCVPMVYNQQVLAVITLVHPEKNHFIEYHSRLMTIVANQATVAVRNAQLFNRLQAQQRQLETVLQAIPDVLLVLDERGHILLVNDAAKEFLGDTDPILVIGRHLGDFADTALAPILETLQSSTTHEDKQWLFEARSEKRKKDLQITLSVWRDAANGFAGYVVAMHDVTMLRDLNRFKDEMLRVASHDLRSPLSLIVGYADLINLDIDPTSPAAEYLSVIHRSTERMNGLLDDLLRVEQARRSPLELNEEVDLGALAVEAVDDNQPLAEHKNQQLTSELRTDGLSGVVADPVLISRAMNNLISNAIKYTPEFGHIHVKTYTQNNRFHFVVEDDGIGIAPENLTRVFESFFRVKDERAGDVAGSGLGLSFVKTIIERHNGDVWVESELGRGSKFGFWLPLNQQ